MTCPEHGLTAAQVHFWLINKSRMCQPKDAPYFDALIKLLELSISTPPEPSVIRRLIEIFKSRTRQKSSRIAPGTNR